ncbi:MAG: hypothetical protein DHS20C16_10410 [Phycisphaerae bacterium]|nr:MAG: hypothetical protein DHS20C16_10410 [Phycisphaerae bacterium]
MTTKTIGANQLNRSNNKTLARRAKHGFTLVELLVVVSIIALLISILLPSLKKAREQAKATVCLSNLRALGQGIMLYATEYDGRLPGPLHPSLYREQTDQNYIDRGITNLDQIKFLKERQLTYKLTSVMNQRGEAKNVNISDGVSTCPSVERVLSDEHFDRFKNNTGRTVFPFHYALNNYGDTSSDPDNDGFSDNVRKTNPPNYFGASPPSGSTADPTSPTTMARIKRSSDEWAVADAWYRRRVSPLPFLQQDGTFQSNWSGTSLTFAPPHRRKQPLIVFDADTTERQTAATTFANKLQDGSTQAVFFDGHAAAVRSKTARAGGSFLLFNGFPGTVNIDFTGISDLMRDNFRSLEWR